MSATVRAGESAGKKSGRKVQRFAVRRTPTGLGLFAADRIEKGAFVIEYTGELIPNEEADRRGGRYLFQVNGRWTIDGRGRANLSRYINHSCKPNCIAHTRGLAVKIYALRAIPPGEELSYDYGDEYLDAYIRPKGCLCPSCRADRESRAARGARGEGRTA